MSEKLELNFDEDRYSRFRLISWWDQDLLKKKKVMVVGAGAIGNEVLKNLALLGVGEVIIVDMDQIENSNLSRSVLYRYGDEGRYKAEVAAERVMEINPDVKATPLVANIVTGVGLGWFKHVDLIIGGLDNREARMAINQKGWLTTRPWIDGAIDVLHGVVRVFMPPEGPCYECTMSEQDYILMNQRRSCALLTRDDMLTGKVPTTPTSASVIAAIQVQEAIKLFHDSPELPVLIGKGFVFNGLTHDSYVVDYQVKEDCYAHETINQEIIPLYQFAAEQTTVGELFAFIQGELGSDCYLELNQEIVAGLNCPNCGSERAYYSSLSAITEADARCKECEELMTPALTHRIKGDEPFLDHTLIEIGIPAWEIIEGRAQGICKYYELAGDRPK